MRILDKSGHHESPEENLPDLEATQTHLRTLKSVAEPQVQILMIPNMGLLILLDYLDMKIEIVKLMIENTQTPKNICTEPLQSPWTLR